VYCTTPKSDYQLSCDSFSEPSLSLSAPLLTILVDDLKTVITEHMMGLREKIKGVSRDSSVSVDLCTESYVGL
jgi:hypothetical protein